VVDTLERHLFLDFAEILFPAMQGILLARMLPKTFLLVCLAIRASAWRSASSWSPIDSARAGYRAGSGVERGINQCRAQAGETRLAFFRRADGEQCGKAGLLVEIMFCTSFRAAEQHFFGGYLVAGIDMAARQASLSSGGNAPGMVSLAMTSAIAARAVSVSPFRVAASASKRLRR
jgi:hypothetical protein